MSSVIMELQTSFYGRRIRPKDFGAEWVSTSKQIGGTLPFPEPASKILLNSRNLPSCRVVLSRWTSPKLQDPEASSGAKKPVESPTKGVKRKFTVLTENDEPQNDDKEMSYSAKIQKNIAEKMAFLESLGIDKFELRSPPKRAVTRKPASAKPLPTQRRKSQRLQKKDPDGQLLPEKEEEQAAEVVKREGPFDIGAVFVSGSPDADKCFLTEPATREMLSEVSNQNKPRDSQECLDAFSRLAIDDTTIKKVVPARITALAVHPSSSVTVVFAGDKLGNFGYFKMGEGESLVQSYSPHTSGLMCLKVNKNQPQRVFSASYDDTVRCLDVERGIFDEVYRSLDENGVLCLDWGLHNSLIVGHSDGAVSLVDPRTRETSSYTLHSKKVRTVNVHPVHEWCFLTGSTDGTAKLWDVRNLKETRSKKAAEAIATMAHHRSCSAAFFSPLTGNQVLTTSFDDTLKVFDSSELTSEVKLKLSLKHNNMTGRWLTPFKAVWIPGCDDLFLVGSMEYPRRVEVFSSAGALQHTLKGDSLTSICSLVDVHPDRFVVAGGNSSGRVHVFVEA